MEVSDHRWCRMHIHNPHTHHPKVFYQIEPWTSAVQLGISGTEASAGGGEEDADVELALLVVGSWHHTLQLPISLSLVIAKPGDFVITDFPCDVQQISKNKNLYLSQVRESNYSHLSIFPIRWWIYDEPILRFKA